MNVFNEKNYNSLASSHLSRFPISDFRFPISHSPFPGAIMIDERIKVRVTETGQVLEVVVLNKRAERIQVVLGEGIHSVKCDLTPTRNGLGYAGSVMGRELIYERSRQQVHADIDRLNPALRKSR